jgi:hypothetical protein
MPINFTQQQRQDLLNALGHGRPNAINAQTLAQNLGYPTGGNQVELRSLIKECIEIDGDLIGAVTGQPAGFFLIGSVAELENYIDTLESRTRSDNERRTALINNWNGNPGNTPTTRQPLIIT